MEDTLHLLKNATLFLVWCRHHIHCDDCGRLGAVPTLDKRFICADCARLMHQA